MLECFLTGRGHGMLPQRANIEFSSFTRTFALRTLTIFTVLYAYRKSMNFKMVKPICAQAISSASSLVLPHWHSQEEVIRPLCHQGRHRHIAHARQTQVPHGVMSHVEMRHFSDVFFYSKIHDFHINTYTTSTKTFKSIAHIDIV